MEHNLTCFRAVLWYNTPARAYDISSTVLILRKCRLFAHKICPSTKEYPSSPTRLAFRTIISERVEHDVGAKPEKGNIRRSVYVGGVCGGRDIPTRPEYFIS